MGLNGAEWLARGYYSAPFSRASAEWVNIQPHSATTPIHPTHGHALCYVQVIYQYTERLILALPAIDHYLDI